MAPKNITPSTKLYTHTAAFAGYTLQESILGDQTPEQYAALSEDRGHSISELCDWLSGADGFWGTAEEAEAALQDLQEAGGTTCRSLAVEEFTPESIHDEIVATAVA